MAQSSIEWTESTWNPVTGCDDASPGCENCYARRMAHRLKAMGAYNYRNGFQVTLQPQMLDRPLKWRKPQRIFVNSMSDMFHVEVRRTDVRKVFDVMVTADWHRFQGAHKVLRPIAEIEQGTALAEKRVDGRQRRERRLRATH